MFLTNRANAASLICLLLCSLPSSLVLAAGGSPFDFNVQSFVVSDDNIGRSQFDADRKDDVILNTTADATFTKGFGTLSALRFTASFRDERFSDFDGLSSSQAGVTVDYRFQTRISFSAPRYSVFVRFTDLDFETDIRDGDSLELGFSVAKRMTNKITAALGVTGSDREARGAVFDLERIRYFGNLDWQLTPRVAMYSNYSFIDGDVFSTATPNLQILNWADAIEPDNAFGGVANSKFVYRLDADTQILRLGTNIAINQGSSLDISVDVLDSDAAGPIDYDLFSFSMGLLVNF